MENQEKSNQNCGCDCSDGCCPPVKKKGNLWTKIIFFIIVLAAGAIITVKLVNKQDEKCCDPTETSTCCPQPKTEE